MAVVVMVVPATRRSRGGRHRRYQRRNYNHQDDASHDYFTSFPCFRLLCLTLTTFSKTPIRKAKVGRL